MVGKHKKIVTIAFIFVVALVSFFTIKEQNLTKMETSIEGKEMTKEDYIYKDKLLSLGYTIQEVKIIENKISSVDVKNYLLNKKYNHLFNFLNSPYFKTYNVERYENYYLLHNDYNIDQITMDVNIGLDNDFYTNVIEVTNHESITTLVNKYYKLNKDATFNDLINIEMEYSNNGIQSFRKVAYTPLVNMIENAKNDGIILRVLSGYRTYDRQEFLFNNSVNKNGLEHALLYSAKPGHSEHELGLAVDFNTTDMSFENTKEYEWLKNNSYKYGFIERYKKGKENITGYGYEPWHYRYVGIDAATKIFAEDITFEEYYVKYLQ